MQTEEGKKDKDFYEMSEEEIRAILGPIAERGTEIYERHLKERLEATVWGKFLIINVDTEEYVIGESGVEVLDKFRAKFPGARGFRIRVGIPTHA